MADKKYKCENGHEFSLDEFDDRKCPNLNCDSERIAPINNNPFDKLIDFLKNNKIIGLGIGGLVVLILILNLYDSCNKKPITTTYKVDISDYDPNIKGFVFHITKITTTDGGEKPETMDFASIAADFNFTVDDARIDASEFKGTDKNIYYPCKHGLFNFKWFYSPRYPHLKGKMKDSKSSNVPANGFSPNEKAKCRDIIKITNVFIKDCDLVVSTNFDTIKTKQVLISIHGKNGPFEKRNRWNVKAEKLTKFVVYCAIEQGTSDTAWFYEKDNQSIFAECGCTPKEAQELRLKIMNAALAYGNAPDSRSLQMAFNETIRSQNIKIKLNGKILNGESELYNIMRTSYNNVGTKYEIVPSSLVITNNCKIESFEFFTK